MAALLDVQPAIRLVNPHHTAEQQCFAEVEAERTTIAGDSRGHGRTGALFAVEFNHRRSDLVVLNDSVRYIHELPCALIKHKGMVGLVPAAKDVPSHNQTMQSRRLRCVGAVRRIRRRNAWGQGVGIETAERCP